MNNELEPYAPMAPMPREIEQALYGRSSTPQVERPDYVPPVNPWAKKVDGDGRLDFIDEDAEEAALQAPLEQIRKLFAPPTPARITPKLGDLPVQPEDPDDEERALYTPIRKLFRPGLSVTAAASTATEDFRFTKRATTPAPKEKRSLKYTKVVIGEDTWNEGRDESGELISMMLITSDED